MTLDEMRILGYRVEKSHNGNVRIVDWNNFTVEVSPKFIEQMESNHNLWDFIKSDFERQAAKASVSQAIKRLRDETIEKIRTEGMDILDFMKLDFQRIDRRDSKSCRISTVDDTTIVMSNDLFQLITSQDPKYWLYLEHP